MVGKQPTLICGTTPIPNSGKAWCSLCRGAIYPTLGSLLYAQANGMEMICTACLGVMPEYIFGGVMHHGSMVSLSDRESSDLVTAITMDEVRKRAK